MIPSGNGAAASGERSGADPMSVMVAVALGLAAVWSVIALRVLSSALSHESIDRLADAGAMFDALRMQSSEDLRVQSRMTASDPRLIAALAAGGPDSAAVADLIAELAHRRGTGVVQIATAEGRIATQAGVEALRGLDLSSTRPLDRAQRSGESVAAGWVVGDRLVDIGIAPVRVGADPIAYVVLAEDVDLAALTLVADRTGVAMVSAVGDTITLSAAGDVPRYVFASTAGRDEPVDGQRIDYRGDSYVASVHELYGPGEQRPRLILARSLARAGAGFTTVRWLTYGPILLVLIAALSAMTARRRMVSGAAGSPRARPA
jgi:hypothetical protein